MSLWSRALVVLAMAIALVPVGVHPAWGCKCAAPTSDAEAARHSTAVFTGVSKGSYGGLTQSVSWRFTVDQVYKGTVHDLETVTSATQSTACGVTFDKNQRYVVFAFGGTGRLTTNSCSNTRPWPADKSLAMGGLQPHDPVPANETDSSTGPNWMLAIVGAVLGAAAFFALLRVRATRPPTNTLD